MLLQTILFTQWSKREKQLYFFGEQNISTSSKDLFFCSIFCFAVRFAAANLFLAAALCSASVAFTSSFDFCRLIEPLPSDDCLESDD